MIASTIYLLTRDGDVEPPLAVRPPPREPQRPQPVDLAPPISPAEDAPPASAPAPAPGVRLLPSPGLAPAAPKKMLVSPRDRAITLHSPEETALAGSLRRFFIAQRSAEVKKCLDRELKGHPADDVTVSLHLTPPHKVAKVRVKDTLKNADLQHCIMRSMKSVQIPELSKEISLEVPFPSKP